MSLQSRCTDARVICKGFVSFISFVLLLLLLLLRLLLRACCLLLIGSGVPIVARRPCVALLVLSRSTLRWLTSCTTMMQAWCPPLGLQLQGALLMIMGEHTVETAVRDAACDIFVGDHHSSAIECIFGRTANRGEGFHTILR